MLFVLPEALPCNTCWLIGLQWSSSNVTSLHLDAPPPEFITASFNSHYILWTFFCYRHFAITWYSTTIFECQASLLNLWSFRGKGWTLTCLHFPGTYQNDYKAGPQMFVKWTANADDKLNDIWVPIYCTTNLGPPWDGHHFEAVWCFLTTSCPVLITSLISLTSSLFPL